MDSTFENMVLTGTVDLRGTTKLVGTALTATAAEINLLDDTVAGTAVASKVLALGANKNVDVLVVADGGLSLGSGAGTAIVATAAEINRVCDSSTKVVALTATTPITAALHASKVCYITGSGAAAAFTLPEATGTGDHYRFFMGEVNTSGTTFVAADTTNASFRGTARILDVDAAAMEGFFTATAGGTDTVTFNGTTTGGRIGDMVEFIDLATDVWHVNVVASVPAGSDVATPFSSAA